MIIQLQDRIRRAVSAFRGEAVPLNPLEAKALWLLAVHGSAFKPDEITRDRRLEAAGECAITKLWNLHRFNRPPRTMP